MNNAQIPSSELDKDFKITLPKDTSVSMEFMKKMQLVSLSFSSYVVFKNFEIASGGMSLDDMVQNTLELLDGFAENNLEVEMSVQHLLIDCVKDVSKYFKESAQVENYDDAIVKSLEPFGLYIMFVAETVEKLVQSFVIENKRVVKESLVADGMLQEFDTIQFDATIYTSEDTWQICNLFDSEKKEVISINYTDVERADLDTIDTWVAAVLSTALYSKRNLEQLKHNLYGSDDKLGKRFGIRNKGLDSKEKEGKE